MLKKEERRGRKGGEGKGVARREARFSHDNGKGSERNASSVRQRGDAPRAGAWRSGKRAQIADRRVATSSRAVAIFSKKSFF